MPAFRFQVNAMKILLASVTLSLLILGAGFFAPDPYRLVYAPTETFLILVP